MQSPRLASRSVVVLVGLGIITGSAAFTARSRSPSSAEAAFAPAKCEYFLKNGADPQYFKDVTDNQGVALRLYRSKGFWEDIDHVKAFKKWVGAVELLTATPSTAFPDLTPGYRGCLQFRARAQQGNARHAQLWDSAGRNLHTYNVKWLCEVSEHGSTVTPDWLPYPEDCNKSFMWVTYKDKEVPVEWPRGQVRAARFSMEEFQAEIERQLRAAGVPQSDRQKILQAIRTAGPWYPCAQTGCCRAIEA